MEGLLQSWVVAAAGAQLGPLALARPGLRRGSHLPVRDWSGLGWGHEVCKGAHGCRPIKSPSGLAGVAGAMLRSVQSGHMSKLRAPQQNRAHQQAEQGLAWWVPRRRCCSCGRPQGTEMEPLALRCKQAGSSEAAHSLHSKDVRQQHRLVLSIR